MELDLNQLTDEQRAAVNKILALQDKYKRGQEEEAALQWGFEHELSKLDFLTDRINFNWKKPFKDENILYQNYVVDRLNALEIANKFSCSKSTVLEYLKLNNIPIREACIAIHKNRNVRYGEKNRSRRRPNQELQPLNLSLLAREWRRNGTFSGPRSL